MQKEKARLLYDGECPVCKRFAWYMQAREHIDIELSSLQDVPEITEELRGYGYDLNEGMVLLFEDQIYQGEEALRVLEEYVERAAKNVTKNTTKNAGENSEKSKVSRLWKLIAKPFARRRLYKAAKAIRVVSYRLRGRSSDLNKAFPGTSNKSSSDKPIS